MAQLAQIFAPSRVLTVVICSGAVPFNSLYALEPSETVFLEQYRGVQLTVELQEG